MKKLVFLALAILAIATLIFPSAAAARGAEVHNNNYSPELLNIGGQDHFASGGEGLDSTYVLRNRTEGLGAKSSYIAGQKLVCLTFDDGWQNQYDNALPVLQQYGFKATFAVVTTWIGNDAGLPDQGMSYSELHTLADQGMDIASHTRTHPHLPTLGASDLQNEVAGSKADLESENFTVRTFVYPYYEYNSSVVTAVKNAGYICARSGALNNPYTPGNRTDPNAQYYIDAVEINTQDITTFKSIVDQATDHSVICLCYHSISDNVSSPTPITPVANFGEQMRYLKDSGFAVSLLPDLVQAPWIAFNPASLAFSGMQGGSNPATQALNITNSGGGTLNWAASSNAAWLTLTLASGTAPSTVTVTAGISGLSAGTYNGTITITATGATNTPQTVPVTLTVQTPSPNWLTGWSYRKQITIAGSSAGAQTNYPMKLTINRSTGSDSGATVYLGTKCASDYKDIRFTKSDGTTLLDYWIESSTSSTAAVWVEFDSIPASPGTANFDLYYGNSGATSASNIQNTFTFADDFEGGTLDAARWTTGGSGGNVTEANGVLTVTASTSDQKYVASVNTYGSGYALHARAKLDSITGCSSYRLLGFITTKGSYADKLFTTVYRWYYSGANFVSISGNGSSATQADMLVVADTNYHVSECRRYAVSGTNYDRFIIDGGAAISGANPTATARYIYINSDEPGKAIVIDWIFLRKFVSVEPTWSVWGSEETSGSLPPSPTIAYSPTSLAFSGVQGGSNPATQALNITNSGGGTLSWTASSNAAWLTLTPASGTAPSTVTVSASISGLSAGTYNGTITITATGATNTPQTVPVTLTVQAPSPTIAFNPASLTFSGIQGGSNPATQALNITNSGGGTLNWAASSNAAWLTLTLASGTAPSTVTVTVGISGLSAGTYNGTITLTATGATNTPQTVPVTLTVQAPSPTIAYSPTSLAFSGMQGGSNPATQALNITNSGGGTLNWAASSNAAWLTLTLASGTAPSTVTVTAGISGLSAGTYNGTITITATGATNTPQTVPVTLTVQTPSPNWLTGWSYRKQITIAGSSAGAQTNYPMKLTINRSTGSDSGATVYLGTKCASDYKDIRFTKSDGTTLLDYWIESSTSSTAAVWVEFDSIPASPGTANFDLYYGNSGATSASNIQNTFTFADDFEGGTLDAARWTTGGSGGNVTEANGVLTVTASTSDQKYVASVNTYGSGYALHARAKLDSITGCSSYRLLGFITTKGSYADKLFTTVYRWYYSGANFVSISGNGSSATQADMLVVADTNYHVSECRRYAVSGTNYDRFIIDGGAAVSGAKPTATARYIYINSDEPGKAIIVDWIFLRKFVSVEPTWSVWGSEQTG